MRAPTGVETLLEDATSADPEWPKLLAVPGLLEPWNDVKDKWQVATEEFKVCWFVGVLAQRCEASALMWQNLACRLLLPHS